MHKRSLPLLPCGSPCFPASSARTQRHSSSLPCMMCPRLILNRGDACKHLSFTMYGDSATEFNLLFDSVVQADDSASIVSVSFLATSLSSLSGPSEVQRTFCCQKRVSLCCCLHIKSTPYRAHFLKCVLPRTINLVTFLHHVQDISNGSQISHVSLLFQMACFARLIGIFLAQLPAFPESKQAEATGDDTTLRYS